MEPLKHEAADAFVQVCLPLFYNNSQYVIITSMIELLILSLLQRKFLLTSDSLLSLHTLSSMTNYPQENLHTGPKPTKFSLLFFQGMTE